MAVKVSDKELLRSFFSSNPVRYAVMEQRVFTPRGESSVFVNDEKNIGALLVMQPPDDEDDSYSIVFAGSDKTAAQDVIKMLPEGRLWLQISDEDLLPVLRERVRMGWFKSSWLLVLDPKDLRGEVRHPVQKIDVKWARRIADAWSRDWDAGDYVKRRLEEGPSSGIFKDGDLVGWGATHFETDKVSMMGFMNIMPEYRNRGYALSITVDLLGKIISSGRTPACHVYVDNYPSLDLCERVGFKRVCTQTWGDGVTVR